MDYPSRWHLLGFFVNAGIGATNATFSGVADQIMTRDPNLNFQMPQSSSRLIWSFGTGVGMDRLRLNVAELRSQGLPSLVPVNITATPPSPYNLYDLRMSPIDLPTYEFVELQTTNTDVAAQNHYGGLAIEVGTTRPTIGGRVYSIRGTCAITLTNGTWVLGTITLDQTLPAGVYALCGAHVICASAVLARFVPASGGYRPGVVVNALPSGIPSPINRDKMLGVWFDFTHNQIPQIEILGSTAGAQTAQVYLDVWMIRKGVVS